MLKLALIIAGIIALAMILLSINILLRGGKFRAQHIGENVEMRRHGIHCVQSMDKIERRQDPHRVVLVERGTKQLKI